MNGRFSNHKDDLRADTSSSGGDRLPYVRFSKELSERLNPTKKEEDLPRPITFFTQERFRHLVAQGHLTTAGAFTFREQTPDPDPITLDDIRKRVSDLEGREILAVVFHDKETLDRVIGKLPVGTRREDLPELHVRPDTVQKGQVLVVKEQSLARFLRESPDLT